REAPDLCLVAQGAPDEGALAPGELEPDVERLDDQENIGEQDRGIDAQTVDGLERHFRRGLGVPAELEEPEPLAHRTVLRQVAARLAHEPDGGVRHRRAARGAQERSIWKRHARELIIWPYAIHLRQAGVPRAPQAGRR